MIMSINDCSSPAIGNLLLVLKNIFNLIMIISPILAIISLVIIFTKMMNNPDDNKIVKKIKNVFIALIIIFLVPVIVNVFMLMLDNSTDISSCWNNVNKTSSSSNYINIYDKEGNKVLSNAEDYEKGEERTTLNKNQKKSVVFIGNSKTYVHSIPDMFTSIAGNGGYKVSTSSITKGGMTLAWHASNNGSKLKQNYDIAVLQEQTDSMQSNLSGYKNGAVAVSNLLRSGNSNVSIYVRECWSYKSASSSTHQAVQSNASSVASAIDGAVIKDGKAWDRFGNDNRLYQDDTHQSKEGAYLSAICIYKALTNDDPTKITYYGGIDSSTAKKFQEIARDVC